MYATAIASIRNVYSIKTVLRSSRLTAKLNLAAFPKAHGQIFKLQTTNYCTKPTRQASTLTGLQTVGQTMDEQEKHEPTNGKQHFFNLCREANVEPKIAFVGGGNMAQALAKGFLKTGILENANIAASDPYSAARDHLQQNLHIRAFSCNRELLNHNGGGIVLLAIKPQQLDEVLEELADQWMSMKTKFGLLVSIVAGASIQKLHSKFIPYGLDGVTSPPIPIIRVMPNTPALIGCGASVFSKNAFCTPAHAAVIKALLDTVGLCWEMTENHIDAVTGLAASGPAFIYTVIDALSDGGVKMGLPRDIATDLAAQMVMGSAKMVLETKKHPGELKNQVCSPAGTTIAGVHVLEEAGVRAAFISAVEAATKRAKELG